MFSTLPSIKTIRSLGLSNLFSRIEIRTNDFNRGNDLDLQNELFKSNCSPRVRGTELLILENCFLILENGLQDLLLQLSYFENSNVPSGLSYY